MDKQQFELLAASLPPEALAALKASMQEAGELPMVEQVAPVVTTMPSTSVPAVEQKPAVPVDPMEHWDNLDKGRELHVLDTGYIIQDNRWVATPSDVVYASDRMVYRHFHLLVWRYDADLPLELATNPDGSLPEGTWVQDHTVQEVLDVKVLAPVPGRRNESRALMQSVLNLVQPRVENTPLYLPVVNENERFHQVLPRQFQCMDTTAPHPALWARWLLRERWWALHMPCRRQLFFPGTLPSVHFQAPKLEEVIRTAKGGDLADDSRARVCWMSTTLICKIHNEADVVSAETVTDPELAQLAAERGWSLARQLNPVLLPFPLSAATDKSKVRLGVDRTTEGFLVDQEGWERATTRWLWGQFIQSYPTW